VGLGFAPTGAEYDVPSTRDLSAIAHDLRTPLATLSIAVESAFEAGNGPQHLRTLAEVIHRNLVWMQELVEEVRGAPNAPAHRRDAVDLHELVHEVGARCGPLLGSRRQYLEIEHSADRFILQADRLGLLRMLGNLLENASKFAPQGDRIRILLRRRPDAMVLQVCDHGPGVPLEERDLVFLPLYRSRSAEGVAGAGLGLATVREVARGHGGEAYFNRRRRETRVTVVLPHEGSREDPDGGRE